MSMSEKQAAEYNRLIVEQGTATRSMSLAAVLGRPVELTDEQTETIRTRAVRMVELAMIAGHYDDPEAEVNRRIAAWLQNNKLSLSTQNVAEFIESRQRPDLGVHSQVMVSIGDLTKGGYYYSAMVDDLTWSHQFEIKVPDGVAEHFRQQGRRQIQREFASLLALESHR